MAKYYFNLFDPNNKAAFWGALVVDETGSRWSWDPKAAALPSQWASHQHGTHVEHRNTPPLVICYVDYSSTDHIEVRLPNEANGVGTFSTYKSTTGFAWVKNPTGETTHPQQAGDVTTAVRTDQNILHPPFTLQFDWNGHLSDQALLTLMGLYWTHHPTEFCKNMGQILSDLARVSLSSETAKMIMLLADLLDLGCKSTLGLPSYFAATHGPAADPATTAETMANAFNRQMITLAVEPILNFGVQYYHDLAKLLTGKHEQVDKAKAKEILLEVLKTMALRWLHYNLVLEFLHLVREEAKHRAKL